VAIATSLLVMGAADLASSSSFNLITQDEARLPPALQEEHPFELRTAGPRIVVRSPIDGGEYDGPIDVDVEFSPGPSGLLVKDETLRVTYLKLVQIDLTGRLRPYFQKDRLHVESVNIPAGRHRISLSIADEGGYTSIASLSFVVH
jgi:hypothetical protein